MADTTQRSDPRVHDLSFEASQDLYGEWAGFSPHETTAAFAGAEFPWWIAGGWAIDAATGTTRFHGDTDVVVLRDDLPALRRLLSDFHLWETDDGALRPLLKGDDLADGCDGLWVRRNARSPWVLDLLLTPSDGRDWLCKRNRSLRLPLDAIGWFDDDVSYLRPEIVLLFKAKGVRPKDEADLTRTVPHLDQDALTWLIDALQLVHPGHPWLKVLTGPISSGIAWDETAAMSRSLSPGT